MTVSDRPGADAGAPTPPPPVFQGSTWTPSSDAARPSWGWITQAVTGAVVLVLITIHMVANHFIVPEGLRNFAQVVEYLSSPIIVAIEVAFLVTVTWHGLLGLRAVLFDFGFSARTEQLITRALTVLGVVTVGYGLWLTMVITSHV